VLSVPAPSLPPNATTQPDRINHTCVSDLPLPSSSLTAAVPLFPHPRRRMNNLWLNLKSHKQIMDKGDMELDIVVNPKTTDNGQASWRPPLVLRSTTCRGRSSRTGSLVR